MPRLFVRRSRRVPGLKDSDYDHEINLVNHEQAPSQNAPSPRPASTETTPPDIVREDTTTALLDPPDSERQPGSNSLRRSAESQPRKGDLGNGEHRGNRIDAGPSIEVQAPTPFGHMIEPPAAVTQNKRSASVASKQQDAAVDILYENERGGFLCGIALFSPKALGNLDPSPWTNAFHRKSRTTTQTAQLPDPSWEWEWPEWRINRRGWTDEGGWEYSFAFAKCFPWHRPRWWNSFVRRRVWVRKRVRIDEDELPGDPHMMRTDYFSIQPADHRQSLSLRRVPSRSSHAGSAADERRISISQVSAITRDGEAKVLDVDTLLGILRTSRIDREKIEAVESYLDHADDLEKLAEHMHEIMSIFVYQVSRRLLLTRLMQTYDEVRDAEKRRKSGEEVRHQNGTGDANGKDNSNGVAGRHASGNMDMDLGWLQRRSQALEKAVKHADEEVKKLAYWSDVKRMTEGGHSGAATDQQSGWDDDKWGGIDQSGPAVPGGGELPG